MIGKIQGLKCNKAIEHIEKCRETRTDKSKNYIPTPESAKQVNQVSKILGCEINRDVPDRSDRSWLKRVRKERQALKQKNLK